jgi:hypothetical protein
MSFFYHFTIIGISHLRQTDKIKVMKSQNQEKKKVYIILIISAIVYNLIRILHG